jgi:hypothetical protein
MNYRLGVRRYFLAAYWLLFAAFTLYLGQFPGYVQHPELEPYPWVGVLVTWIVLAAEVAILYWILRPVTFSRSWGRLGFALLYVGALFVFGAVTFVTDMPGYHYVPAYFSAATLLGLLIFGLLMGLRSFWERVHHAP